MNIKNTLNLAYIRFSSINKKNLVISLMLIALSTILLKSSTEVMAQVIPGNPGQAPGVPP